MTALFEAVSGRTVAFSLKLSPTFVTTLDLLSFTPITGVLVTLTTMKPPEPFPPSAGLQVMIALPTPTAVILPFELTLTIFGLLDSHLTFAFFAPEGLIVGFSVVLLLSESSI